MNPYDDEPTSRRSRQPRSDADPYPGGYDGGYDDRGGRDRGYDDRVGGYDDQTREKIKVKNKGKSIK